MDTPLISDPKNTLRSRAATGAVIWVCAVQFFVVQVIAQAAWTTPYSLLHNYISDLGNTVCGDYLVGEVPRYVCSPLHWLMNISFFLQGVIIMAGAIFLSKAMRPGKAKTWVLILLFLTGVGMLGVGLFPENDNNEWHVYSAALQFITGNTALIVAGAGGVFAGFGKGFRVLSILLGAAGLVASALFPTGIYFGIGIGGMERIAAYAYPIWMMTVGVLVFAKSSRGAEA